MEVLKKLEEVCQEDPRHAAFVKFDPSARDGFRRRELPDHYHRIAAITLNPCVPDEIRSHFETARNLAVYAWYFYPFNVTAQLCAYISVEFALRTKTNNRDKPFRRLLKEAVDAGWIADHGFSVPTQRLQRQRERNAELPPMFQEPEPILARSYADAMAEAIPFLRNEIAHGCSMLHGDGLTPLLIAAEIINQLYPSTQGVGNAP